jgi:hypothetical protein
MRGLTVKMPAFTPKGDDDANDRRAPPTTRTFASRAGVPALVDGSVSTYAETTSISMVVR